MVIAPFAVGLLLLQFGTSKSFIVRVVFVLAAGSLTPFVFSTLLNGSGFDCPRAGFGDDRPFVIPLLAPPTQKAVSTALNI